MFKTIGPNWTVIYTLFVKLLFLLEFCHKLLNGIMFSPGLETDMMWKSLLILHRFQTHLFVWKVTEFHLFSEN